MKHFIYLFFTTLSLGLFAQNPLPEPGPVFSDDVVPRIDILIAESDLQTLFEEGNEYSDFEHPATFIFNNGSTIDTLEEVGFRFRGNTSRVADKKSFKVSFNTYVSGRKFYGLEKMNLNGEHNDPTVSRAKISWQLLRLAGLSGSRANHIELYVNGDYYGVYANVEHIDEEYIRLRYGDNNGNLYKCLWPAHLIWQGFEPELYKEETNGRRAYDLKINDDADNYIDLADFINVIGNTFITQLPCELEKIFDVNSYLRYLAFEIMTGHWDNYVINKNNFYLYRNPKTGLFEYIPYDLDNTLGVNFLGSFDFSQQDIYNYNDGVSQSRPLYSRILQVPEYKDRLSLYINELRLGILDFSDLFPLLDQVQNQLEEYVEDDPFFPLDYNFELSDFQQSFSGSISNYGHLPFGIRSFLEARKNSALEQLELNDISPIITHLQHNYPKPIDSIFINAFVFDDQEITSVEINYQFENGNIETLELFDDGLHHDSLANDGIYGIALAPSGADGIFSFSITALDNMSQSNTRPICNSKEILIGQNNNALTLRINEFMADNNNTLTDEVGEYDDWIEIHNFGEAPIDLRGKYLTDDLTLPAKWPFPELTIEPGAYLLFWADDDQEQGENHTNFKLRNSGEVIVLIDDYSTGYAQIDAIEYVDAEEDVAIGRLPNGTGPWQNMDMATPNDSNDPFDTSVEDLQIDFKVFPNPATAEIQIQLSESYKEQVLWELIDVLGRKTMGGKLEANQETISVEQFPRGFYNLVLRNDLHQSLGNVKLLLE